MRVKPCPVSYDLDFVWLGFFSSFGQGLERVLVFYIPNSARQTLGLYTLHVGAVREGKVGCSRTFRAEFRDRWGVLFRLALFGGDKVQ